TLWSYFVVHFDGTLAAIPGIRPAFGSPSPAQFTFPVSYPAAVLAALIPLWTFLAFASVAAFTLFLFGSAVHIPAHRQH
ncbi:hypothetical protein HK405_007970, partial [Cladochytrium tenue]